MDFLARIRSQIETSSLDQLESRVQAAFNQIRSEAARTIGSTQGQARGAGGRFIDQYAAVAQSAGSVLSREVGAGSLTQQAANAIQQRIASEALVRQSNLREVRETTTLLQNKIAGDRRIREEQRRAVESQAHAAKIATLPRLRGGAVDLSGLAGGDQPDLNKTVADEAIANAEQADLIARRAANKVFIQSTVELATEQNALAAEQALALAASREYLRSTTQSAAARQLLSAEEAAALAADSEYQKATLIAARSRARLAIVEDEMVDGDEELRSINAQAARSQLSRRIRDAEARGTDPDLIGLTVGAGEAERLSGERVALARLGLAEQEGETAAMRRARIAVAERALAEQQRVAELQVIRGASQEEASLIVKRRVLEKQVNAELNARVQAEINQRRQAGEAAFQGTAVQRLQQFIATRSGGTPRLASEFLTGRQLVSSRLLTTGGFALSGALLFGTISGLRETVREATELERQLAAVRGQFDSTFGGEAQAQFKEFRAGILDIAKDSGASADSVAFVARQLVGVFRDANTGLPDPAKALQQAKTAFRFAEVTGLDPKEINDSLTAIALSFNTSFEEIADNAIFLEDELGVLASETVKFVGDLGPLGNALGFTAQQLAELGAVTQQVSGRSGAALSEQLGRALSQIQDNADKILQIYSQTPALAGKVDEIAHSFGAGDIQEVLSALIRDYNVLSKAQRIQLVDILGGPRQAAVVVALLERGATVLGQLGNGDPTGRLTSRFERFRDTVALAFRQMERAFEEFGLSLFEAGLGDLLRDLAEAGSVVAGAATTMLHIFSALNDMFGGLPGKVVAYAIALRGLTAIIKTLQTLGILNFLGGAAGAVGGGFRGAFTGPGGLASPITTAGGFYGPAGTAARVPVGLGRVSQAGQFGAGLAAAAGRLAPLAAIVAVGQAKSEYDKQQSRVGDSADRLADQVSKLTDEQIQAFIEAGTGRLKGVGERLAFAVLRQKAPIDIFKDEVEKRRVPADVAKLRAAAVELRKQGAAPGLDPAVANAYLAQADDFERLAGQRQADPTDTGAAERAELYLKSVAAGNLSYNKVLQTIFAQIDTDQRHKRDLLEAAAAAAAGSELAALNLEQAQRGVAQGTVPLGKALAIADTSIRNLRSQLAGANETNNQALARELEGRIRDVQDARQQIIDNLIGGTDELRTKLIGALGGRTETAELDAARRRLESLADDASPSERFDRVIDVVAAERAVIERQIARAASLEEAQRIAAGYRPDAALRSEAIRLQLLLDNQSTGFLTEAAGVMGQSVDEVSRKIVAQIVEYGESAEQVSRKILEARRVELLAIRNQVSRLRGFGTEDISSALADIDRDINIINGLLSGPQPDVIDPNGGGGQDAQDKINDALKKKAEGQLSLAKALAQGDPLKEADAELTAATYLLSIATPEEKDQAQARVIQAQTARQQVLLDIAKANRELIVAASNDDPVQAARAAQADAADAAANAHGAAAQARAAAERIRADQTLHDALDDVLTSQVDMVAAAAAAAGDTTALVKAEYDKAVHALADFDLTNKPGENVAQRNKLITDVINQKAQLDNANLERTLKDITDAFSLGQDLRSGSLLGAGLDDQVKDAFGLATLTADEAVKQLRELLKIPGLTKEQTRRIVDAINQIVSEVSNEGLQFNLPTELGLPTLYEARRGVQSGAAGQGYYGERSLQSAGGAPQDNRVFQIQFNVENAADWQEAVGAFIDVVDPSGSRFGVRPNLYTQ